MKRVALFVAALLLLPAVPAQAAGQDASPRLRIERVVTQQGGSHVITIRALDRDGIMSEILVDLGDGVQMWTLLACDETTRPGDPVELEVEWTYAPGRYIIVAQGYSTPRCFDGGLQQSRSVKRRLNVR